MSRHDALTRWKTGAWQAPDMVAWYSRQMVSTAGINALKNEVELDILTAYLVGPRLIDIGVGTGRGSLPFARRGWQVTGVDSSAAMLEETRRLAAGVPVELRVGDVTRVPAPDGAFDSAMALNVMVHVPHWREALDEWVRLVRPGGRLMFDVNSLDHINAAHGARWRHQDLIPADSDTGGFGTFMLALARQDILDYAAARGLSVVAIEPYGLLASDSSFIPAPEGGFLRDRRWWLRLLSWVAADQSLMAFCRWIERRLLPALPTACAGRFMVVLAKPEPGTVPSRPLEPVVSPEGLVRRLGADAATLAAELDAHLASPRNRVVAHVLLQVMLARSLVAEPVSWLSPERAAMFRRWRAEEAADRQALALLDGWHRQPELAAELFHADVPLGPGLAYDALAPLLAATAKLRELR